MLSDITSLFQDITSSLLNQGEPLTASEIYAEVVSYLNSIITPEEVLWSDAAFVNTVTDGHCAGSSVCEAEGLCGACYCGVVGNMGYQQIVWALEDANTVTAAMAAYGISEEYRDNYITCSLTTLRDKIVYNPKAITKFIASIPAVNVTTLHAILDYFVQHERRHAVQGEEYANIISVEGLRNPYEDMTAYCAQPWEHDADMAAINYVRQTYHI